MTRATGGVELFLPKTAPRNAEGLLVGSLSFLLSRQRDGSPERVFYDS